MAEPRIDIEVAHAAVDWQRVVSFSVPAGTTVGQVLKLEEVQACFAGLDFTQMAIGIFGKIIDTTATHVLKPFDRIEIYRSLLADPKETRKLRAAKAAAERAGTKKPG